MTISKEAYLDFVNENQGRDPGSDAFFYQRVFERHDGTRGLFIAWSWFAFLFSGFWLFYRRLYLLGILYFIFCAAFSAALDKLLVCDELLVWRGDIPAISKIALVLTPHILIGAFGVSIYQSHVLDWIEENRVYKKGVNEVLTWILVILCLAYSIFS